MTEQIAIHDVLKQYWGYDEFRSPQEDIIRSFLQGKDTLALLPTGGGKSLCYQLPSLVVPGWTIVISPLISLMQDQEVQLLKKQIPVIALHSGLHPSALKRRMQDVQRQDRGLLYLSPERISTEAFQEVLRWIKVSLIAVDEAHCISQWGHDFRPAYLKISELRQLLPKVPVLAVTGTATPKVEADIIQYLGLRNPKIFKNSFARTNIDIHVLELEQKWMVLLRLLQKMEGSKIIYVRSRRKTMELAQFLQGHGLSALPYHAGMTTELRQSHQQQWIEGKAEIVVATSAFGMGVDKSDVRGVFHLEWPPSIEEYYQEIGRAGRDGQRSDAVLMIHPQDTIKLNQQLESQLLSKDTLKAVFQWIYKNANLEDGRLMLDLESWSLEIGEKPSVIRAALNWLSSLDYIGITSGVVESSRIHISAPREQVLQWIDQDQPSGQLLKGLLRIYEGLWTHATKVHEPDIAKKLNWPLPRVIEVIKKLEAHGLLDYFNGHEGQVVEVTGEHMGDWKKHLRLDYKRYLELYHRRRDRALQMTRFVGDVECRQNYVLHYFNETPLAPCGHCDLCRERDMNVQKVKTDVRNSLSVELQSKSGVLIYDFVLRFPLYQKRVILRALKELIAERKVLLKDQMLKAQDL